ncbi:hypothetical protein V865_000739 [Kwoniella europaea PYCC6329]|uniref:Mediator of RNA polymerase II transcription subunit 11 n=1 Tax=Kwoniella europaea PYCC6329 TaxID=1423913 RepID=A0AAX4K9U7_9TREE
MQDYFSLPIEPENPETEYIETRRSLESCITGISSLTERLGITLRHQQDDQSLLGIYRELQHTFEHTSTQFQQQKNLLDAIMTKLEFPAAEKTRRISPMGNESYLKEVEDARRMAEEFGSFIQASVYQATEDSPLGKAFQSYSKLKPQVDELTSQPWSNTEAGVAGSSNDVEMDDLADLLATKFTAA